MVVVSSGKGGVGKSSIAGKVGIILYDVTTLLWPVVKALSVEL